MTILQATISGRTVDARIDDEPGADHRSRLGHALSNIAASGRDLAVTVPDGRVMTIGHLIIQDLARDGHGTESRISTLIEALVLTGVSRQDARGVAIRTLATIDQLGGAPVRRAGDADRVVAVAIGEGEDRVVASRGAQVIGEPRTAPSQSVASTARPEHRPTPLRPEVAFGLSDLAVHGHGVTAVLDPEGLLVYDSTATARGEGRRLEISPASMFIIASSADPIAELTRFAREQGVRLTRDQATSIIEQSSTTHDLPARAMNHALARGVDHFDLRSFDATGTQRTLHLTADDMRAIAAAPGGEARFAVFARIAEREHFDLGTNPDDRLINCMAITADIQEQLGAIEASHL